MLNKHNILKKSFPAGASVIIFAVVLLFFATSVSATIIYPSDLRWSVNNRIGGSSSISDINPRGGNDYVENNLVGNASLALTTTGNLNDWAFYTRSVGNPGWGLLSDINALSFDWYRETAIRAGLVDWDPWNVQTPALRLLINDAGTISELVWERFYTPSNQTTSMQIGSWVEQDLMNQNFWRHIFSPDGYTISTGENVDPFIHDQTLMALSLSSWASSNNFKLDYHYSDAATVYGLSVGVGSNWPYPYSGFVDNIFLSFDNINGIVISDNFELPVPEPSTLLLLVLGMAVLTAGGRWCGKLSQV